MRTTRLPQVTALAFGPALALILTTAAGAQTAVSTFGATDARRCYEDALSPTMTDVRTCDAALRKGDLSVRDRRATRVNRGIILNRQGAYDEAISDFDAALSGNPDLSEALLNRVNSYFLKKDFDRALMDYQAALDAGLRKSHVAWYNIGLVRAARKDTPGAVEAYRKALEAAPDFAPAREKLDTALKE